MKKLFTFMLILVSAFSFYQPNTTFACSCAMPENPEQELEKSDYVFIGTVWKVETVTITEEVLPGEMLERTTNEVTLKDISNIKWVETPTFTLYTPEQSATCGINFEENKEYIVYALEQEDGTAWAWLCGRTSLTENAQEDLEVFASFLQEETNNPTNQNTNEPIETQDESETETEIINEVSQEQYIKIIVLLLWILLFSIIWMYKIWKKDMK